MGRKKIGKFEQKKPLGKKYRSYIFVELGNGKVEVWNGIYKLELYDSQELAKVAIDKFFERRKAEKKEKKNHRVGC